MFPLQNRYLSLTKMGNCIRVKRVSMSTMPERDFTGEEPRDPCRHEWQDLFDGWQEEYIANETHILYRRMCEECGEREEHKLTPGPDSSFNEDFNALKEQETDGGRINDTPLENVLDEDRGDIHAVMLEVVQEKTDTFDAYGRIVIYYENYSGPYYHGLYYFYA